MTHYMRAARLHKLLTHIRVYFVYRNGALYHRFARGGVRVGAKFGTINSSGYLTGWCSGKNYLIHRLIFLYNNFYLPATVDHEDRNTLNNLIGNLRKSTPTLQCLNRNKFKGSSSKYKGVYYSGISKINPWKAQASIGGGSQLHIGLYPTELAAKSALDRFHELNDQPYENEINTMSNKTDEDLNFSVTCTKPNGKVVTHKYHKLLDVLIERNNSAKKVMALFECCDRIRAGEVVDGVDCEMRGYSFLRVK